MRKLESFRRLICLTLALTLAVVAFASGDEQEFVYSPSCSGEAVEEGRIMAGVSSEFAYGGLWGGYGGRAYAYLDEEEEPFFSGALEAWGVFCLPGMTEGEHKVRLVVSGGSRGDLEYEKDIEYGRVVYSETAECRLDWNGVGELFSGDTATALAYGNFWGGEEAELKVVNNEGSKVFESAAGEGEFCLPLMEEGIYALRMVLTNGSFGVKAYQCRIMFTGYPFFESGLTSIDTVTPQTTITLLTTDNEAFSLHWGRIEGEDMAVLADGLEGSISAGVKDYEVFSSKEGGRTETFCWNYGDVGLDTLPRGAYKLKHVIYDGEYRIVDTAEASVRLLPEPMGLLGLMMLWFFGKRKFGLGL